MKWITRRSIVLTLSLLVYAGFMGIFPIKSFSAQDSAQGAQSAIDGIFLSGAGAQTELIVKLSSPATYTSYKTSAPLRLVIDLSLTSPGAISTPLVFNKGNFRTVTVNRYDTEAGVMTRIDIELLKDSDPVLSVAPDKPGELKVSFPNVDLMDSGSSPAIAPVSVPAPQMPVVAANSPVAEAAQSAPIVDRVLQSLTVQDKVIVLAIENGAAEIKTMRLNKPDRYVVDLFDVRSGLADKLIPVNTVGIASARIGMYPEKLRIVFDGINDAFPEAAAVKTAEGVIITLNGSAVEETSTKRVTPASPKETAAAKDIQPVESTTVPAPVAATPTARMSKKTVGSAVAASVEMIDFQVIDGISRVSVKVTGNVSADAPELQAGFVTLTIKNANLPNALQRSLETKAFTSPVLRITPLLIKTSKGHDTKIRIAMRTAAPYTFRREGDIFYVDFTHTNGIKDQSASDLRELQPQLDSKVAASVDSDLGSVLAADPVRPSEAEKKYTGRKVSLEFADAEVRKIFQLLSEVSNKNFVLGDDVTGTISIKLVNVPWDQALDIILDTKGLDKRQDGNIIIIKGKGKFKSQAEEEQEIKRALTRSIELKTETFNVNYADTVGIAAQFASLKTDRGTIAQDVRTNKVIVKDIPQALDDMRRLLYQLDIPEKQVMIEARIVEATSTFSRNLGVNWGVHFRDGSASFMGINSLDTGFGGLTSAPPTSGTGTSAGGNMGISFGTLTSNIQLDMRLNAAASAGLIKIVSTPKVATLNNKTAKITQGQQIPYTSSTSDKVETKFIEAALSLEVTPHINANGTIGMKIDAKNDSAGAGGDPPPINKKQATTEMLLRDGETTVIGGIFVDSDSESDDGVPFLMDIPLLGKLFKTNNKSKTKTELLIFITPRILGSI